MAYMFAIGENEWERGKVRPVLRGAPGKGWAAVPTEWREEIKKSAEGEDLEGLRGVPTHCLLAVDVWVWKGRLIGFRV